MSICFNLEDSNDFTIGTPANYGGRLIDDFGSMYRRGYVFPSIDDIEILNLRIKSHISYPRSPYGPLGARSPRDAYINCGQNRGIL